MAVKVNELIAKFDNDHFEANPMAFNTPNTFRKSTSFSIKQLVKLFEPTIQDCIDDEQFKAKAMPSNAPNTLRKNTSFSLKQLIKLFEKTTQDEIEVDEFAAKPFAASTGSTVREGNSFSVKQLIKLFEPTTEDGIEDDELAAELIVPSNPAFLLEGAPFSIQQLIKLFESATEVCPQDLNTDDQSNNVSNPADIEPNEARSNGQFEKTSSSEEYEVFPDIICEDITTDVDRMGPGTVGNGEAESQYKSVEQCNDGDENMTCGDVDRLAQGPVKTTRNHEELSSVTVSGAQFEKASAPHIAEDVFPDVHNVCDDGISVNRIDNTIPADKNESENEIEPSLNQGRSSLVENDDKPVNLEKQGPNITARKPQTKRRNKNYLTRYLIKFARNGGSRVTRKQDHGHNKMPIKRPQDGVASRVGTKGISSMFTSCFAGCFGFGRKSSSKVTVKSTAKEMIITSIPIPSAKDGGKDGNIEITITAALCE